MRSNRDRLWMADCVANQLLCSRLCQRRRSGLPADGDQMRLISSEHRACREDQDCSLVYRACCPCGGDDRADAVNRRFAKQYEYQCSKGEIRACAERGACAGRAVPVAVYRKQSCVVELKPVAR